MKATKSKSFGNLYYIQETFKEDLCEQSETILPFDGGWVELLRTWE